MEGEAFASLQDMGKSKYDSYDHRSSVFVNEGDHHGVGYTNPIGTASTSKSSPIPMGRPQTMSIDPKRTGKPDGTPHAFHKEI